ncbi:hypothetical protein ACYG9R_09145 [Mesorhizobium sp. RSR565B]|uniref:hypothetical protein n=1 Tax=Mesorhizobium sp. L103C565B0 TaxID=1287094 RepID=UPI0003CFC10C|nr:hypothetical protein [Mesorhizobium sp. L103C565B0]ESZ50966.1 hypothetical protein X730_12005 [Mesorhizobium sp. L103C565B0]
MNGDDDRKSHLRLAVENSQRDIDRESAKREIGWPLRELAANIIRTVRGAGKSYEISEQCGAVVEAFRHYREMVGHWPASWEIEQALSIRRDSYSGGNDEAWEREHARETILRGALQVTASRLVGQNTQEQRGRSEMMDGVNDIVRTRDATRKRLAEANRISRQASVPRTAARKKTKKPPVKSPRSKADPDIKL